MRRFDFGYGIYFDVNQVILYIWIVKEIPTETIHKRHGLMMRKNLTVDFKTEPVTFVAPAP